MSNELAVAIQNKARSSRQEILGSIGLVDNGEPLAKQIKNHYKEKFQMSASEANQEYLSVMRGEKARIASQIDLVTQAGWIAESRWGAPSKKDGNVKKLHVTFTEVAAPKVKPFTKAQLAILKLSDAQRAEYIKMGLIIEEKPREVVATPVVDAPALTNGETVS